MKTSICFLEGHCIGISYTVYGLIEFRDDKFLGFTYPASSRKPKERMVSHKLTILIEWENNTRKWQICTVKIDNNIDYNIGNSFEMVSFKT